MKSTQRAILTAAAALSVAGTIAGCNAGGPGASAPGDYVDGTYTADGTYNSPGGPESITVEVTLRDNTITTVTVTPHGVSPNAMRFQGEFVEGIADEVVGRNIDSLAVSRVAGSSLTSGGFNDAISKIKADAAE